MILMIHGPIIHDPETYFTQSEILKKCFSKAISIFRFQGYNYNMIGDKMETHHNSFSALQVTDSFTHFHLPSGEWKLFV